MQNLNKKQTKKDNENEKKKTLSVNIVKSNTIVLRDKERDGDGLDIGSARLNAIGILKNHIQYYIYPD